MCAARLPASPATFDPKTDRRPRHCRNRINALAKKYDIEPHETPVGFKYIGKRIRHDKIAIGGQESAGLSVRHHVPEKDGVLRGLLCCEAVACRGKSLGEQLRSISNQVGSFLFATGKLPIDGGGEDEVH